MSEIINREIVIEKVSAKNKGIKAKDGLWFNANPEVSEDFQKDIEEFFSKVGVGDTVELTGELGNRKFNKAEIKKKGEKGSDDWQGDIIKFETLLNLAHKKGLHNIETEMISVDWEKKTALFKATVVTIEGKGEDSIRRTFQAYGDATQENIGSEKVKMHWIRLAETRAIARSLRWATNNAKCSDAEIEDVPEEVVK